MLYSKYLYYSLQKLQNKRSTVWFPILTSSSSIRIINSSVNSIPAILAVMNETMQPAMKARSATLAIATCRSGAIALSAPTITASEPGLLKLHIAKAAIVADRCWKIFSDYFNSVVQRASTHRYLIPRFIISEQLERDELIHDCLGSDDMSNSFTFFPLHTQHPTYWNEKFS